MTQEDMGGLLQELMWNPLGRNTKTTAVCGDAPVNNQYYTKL
jgi:hypothetical protein